MVGAYLSAFDQFFGSKHVGFGLAKFLLLGSLFLKEIASELSSLLLFHMWSWPWAGGEFAFLESVELIEGASMIDYCSFPMEYCSLLFSVCWGESLEFDGVICSFSHHCPSKNHSSFDLICPVSEWGSIFSSRTLAWRRLQIRLKRIHFWPFLSLHRSMTSNLKLMICYPLMCLT